MVMQQHFNPREARTLVVLAVPVFLAQLAQTSMGFVDRSEEHTSELQSQR